MSSGATNLSDHTHMKNGIHSTKLTPKFHITRMHSSRMRTARSSSRPGGAHQAPPLRTRHPPPGTRPLRTRPPPGPGSPPPVNRITDTCKTLPSAKLRLRAVITEVKRQSLTLRYQLITVTKN